MSVPLQAGRELDALVAAKVFGWPERKPSWPERKATANRGGVATRTKTQKDQVPAFSTDLAEAWKIVEKVGGDFDLSRKRGYPWVAHFIESRRGALKSHEGVSYSPCHAICVAALRAIGAA
jgi:hypothetical protein